MPSQSGLQYYIDNNLLTGEQVSGLSYMARLALENADVQTLVITSRLTIAQVLAVTLQAGQALEYAEVRALVTAGTLTADQVLAITYQARLALQNAEVRALVTAGTLTIDQVLAITYQAGLALDNADIRALVTAGTLTADQVLAITYEAILALQHADIRELVTAGTLTADQVLAITYQARLALQNAEVRALVTTGTLTIDQVLAITYQARLALENAGIRALVTAGTLTIVQITALIDAVNQVSENPAFLGMLARGLVTPAQWGQLIQENQALQEAGIQALVTACTLTMTQMLTITPLTVQALRNPFIRELLTAGPQTPAQIFALLNGAGPVAAPAPIINDSQSTHHARVHQSVSESATRLDDHYGPRVAELSLDNIIVALKTYVDSLDDAEKNKAAKACILRITAPEYAFVDPGSGVSTLKLLALAFLAIHDAANRVGSLEDALAQFVAGLCEIQREYNLSATGSDQGGSDRPACCGGTFNKVVEKLVGIHPDCQVRFITPETVSLKLPVVVREEAMRYLESLASPQRVEELMAFTRLMGQIQAEGIRVVWDAIKDAVAERMWDEFGSLYSGAADPRFTALVEAGQDANLGDLSRFREQLQQSVGYRRYCSQVLRDSCSFFGSSVSDRRIKELHYLSTHRHDNPAAQEAFDQQFGMVLRT